MVGAGKGDNHHIIIFLLYLDDNNNLRSFSFFLSTITQHFFPTILHSLVIISVVQKASTMKFSSIALLVLASSAFTAAFVPSSFVAHKPSFGVSSVGPQTRSTLLQSTEAPTAEKYE
jgi:hypothetical protein